MNKSTESVMEPRLARKKNSGKVKKSDLGILKAEYTAPAAISRKKASRRSSDVSLSSKLANSGKTAGQPTKSIHVEPLMQKKMPALYSSNHNIAQRPPPSHVFRKTLLLHSRKRQLLHGTSVYPRRKVQRPAN